jgi:hypothetical protein|tara:strand:- start:15441 stop:16409 length:969 start_codon:yes stop_codon:yes gene_type:complete
MSYIGKTPTVGNFIKLDSLTASATASYTMQHGGVNFQPESALHMLVSLNGVIQSPNTSFTISGSTITFSSALTSSDSIDFIIVYGNVLDIGVPSDSTVTNAKTNFVSTSSAAGLQIKGDGTTDGTLQLNCSQNSHGIKLKSPAHSAGASYTLTFPTTDGNADEFLKTDGSGALSWASAGGTNTPNFSAVMGSNQSVANSTNTKLLYNTEEFDSGGCYDASNSKFVVPSGQGGKYIFTAQFEIDTVDSGERVELKVFKNGSEDARARQFTVSGHDGREQFIENTFVLNLSASDYIEIYSQHNVGQTRTYYASHTRFSGFKLIE